MTMSIYDNRTLAYVVEDLTVPPSVLLDDLFTMVQTEESETIHFDIDDSKPRLTPFCSPEVAGKVVQSKGFKTSDFKPAYCKDKRVHKSDRAIKRRIGEAIGAPLTGAERAQAALKADLEDQLAGLIRRQEVMACQALRTGTITVTGDDYPTQVIDFERDPAHTVTLSGASRWGQPGISPVEDLEDWAQMASDKSGAAMDTVYLDAKSARLLKKDDNFKEAVDTRRGSAATAEIGPQATSQRRKKYWLGNLGDLTIWVYNDTYIDDAGVTQKMLPDHTVIMVSSADLEGTRCYGMIKDEKAGFKALDYFVKTWLVEDPAVRYLLLQCAPLPVPYRINASFCATVN